VSVFVFDIIYIHVCCVIFLSRFRELLSRIWWSSLFPSTWDLHSSQVGCLLRILHYKRLLCGEVRVTREET